MKRVWWRRCRFVAGVRMTSALRTRKTRRTTSSRPAPWLRRRWRSCRRSWRRRRSWSAHWEPNPGPCRRNSQCSGHSHTHRDVIIQSPHLPSRCFHGSRTAIHYSPSSCSQSVTEPWFYTAPMLQEVSGVYREIRRRFGGGERTQTLFLQNQDAKGKQRSWYHDKKRIWEKCCDITQLWHHSRRRIIDISSIYQFYLVHDIKDSSYILII